MTTMIEDKIWKLHNYKSKKVLMWGLDKGYVKLYDNELIKKLRTIYSGGIPASIILLSDGLSNGFCYDRALLLARAFLDLEDDIKLIYAKVDSLKLNPELKAKEGKMPSYAEHCFLERISKDGKDLIYDTSTGLVYDKKIYWLIENPKILRTREKDDIKQFVELEKKSYPNDFNNDKYISSAILPLIEMTYDRKQEMYADKGIELLQREIEEYKKKIDYEKVCQEIEEDMKRKGFIKK